MSDGNPIRAERIILRTLLYIVAGLSFLGIVVGMSMQGTDATPAFFAWLVAVGFLATSART